MSDKSRTIICITGLPGAGKSTVAQVASDMGFKVINMGDVVREEAERRGVRNDDSNLGEIMLQLRRTKGPAVVAELCLPQIMKSNSNSFVIDGVRSVDEINVFKTAGNVKVLAVSAEKKLRKNLLLRRGRSDAPQDRNSFEERDVREIEVGVGKAIEVADVQIENDGITLDSLREKSEIVLKKIG